MKVSLVHTGMVELLHGILADFSVDLRLICEEGVIDAAAVLSILDPAADGPLSFASSPPVG